MATNLHQWLEQAKKSHTEAASSAKGLNKGAGVSKKPKTDRPDRSDGVRKAVVAVGDYVQELGRWVGIFQGGFFIVIVFKKWPGFERSMSITSEFAQCDELHGMAWAALMEDLTNLAVAQNMKPHIDICKQFLDVDPSTWKQQMHFCRVCLTHEKERIKIQLWIDPKLDRHSDAVIAISSTFNAMIYLTILHLVLSVVGLQFQVLKLYDKFKYHHLCLYSCFRSQRPGSVWDRVQKPPNSTA